MMEKTNRILPAAEWCANVPFLPRLPIVYLLSIIIRSFAIIRSLISARDRIFDWWEMYKLISCFWRFQAFDDWVAEFLLGTRKMREIDFIDLGIFLVLFYEVNLERRTKRQEINLYVWTKARIRALFGAQIRFSGKTIFISISVSIFFLRNRTMNRRSPDHSRLHVHLYTHPLPVACAF